jgi:type IV pilus assembly protein PilN
MPRINLLPWREELRQKRKKEFLLAVLSAVLMAAALTFGTKVYYQGLISNQDSRNDMLRAEIADLDKQIAEIESFESQRDRLLDRMEIIEELQRSRPESVHLMDELVTALPTGVYLTSVTQQGRNIELIGNTQSGQRIANMMRNVEESEWLRNPAIGRIETTGSGPVAEGQFRFRAEQVPTVDEEGLR